jgi:hypothetical protein
VSLGRDEECEHLMVDGSSFFERFDVKSALLLGATARSLSEADNSLRV